MDTTTWLQQQIKELEEQADDYIDKAFWIALNDMVVEQAKRIEQSQGELDGRMWSTGKW